MVTYITVGSFGYIGFARNLKILSDKNLANAIILTGYTYEPGTTTADNFTPIVTIVS